MLRTLESLGPVSGKRVILRADLNVPMRDGQITDDGRIRAVLGTLQWLIERDARVLVCSHLGRPKASEPEFSLAPVAARLSELLGQPVEFAADTVGVEARGVALALAPGGVAVLENLRFNSAETSSDTDERFAFAKKLAELGELVVSDGFGAVHRGHASVYELMRLLPSAAGELIETEVSVLQRLTETPERPYTVVLGGAKVSDKLAVIKNLLPRVDNLLIGGGMAFTLLAAKGYKIGNSLVEVDQIDTVRALMSEAEALNVNLVLPSDIVVAASFSATAEHRVATADSLETTDLGSEVLGLDIGPESAESFAKIVRDSRTVFWNGPMGVFEFEAFSGGTKTVAGALTQVSGLCVVGGGDSAAAVRQLGFADEQFGHISTGGGASLEFLEGRTLPGLEVLND
jgi:phosphoglycerate kinase